MTLQYYNLFYLYTIILRLQFFGYHVSLANPEDTLTVDFHAQQIFNESFAVS